MLNVRLFQYEGCLLRGEALHDRKPLKQLPGSFVIGLVQIVFHQFVDRVADTCLNAFFQAYDQKVYHRYPTAAITGYFFQLFRGGRIMHKFEVLLDLIPLILQAVKRHCRTKRRQLCQPQVFHIPHDQYDMQVGYLFPDNGVQQIDIFRAGGKVEIIDDQYGIFFVFNFSENFKDFCLLRGIRGISKAFQLFAQAFIDHFNLSGKPVPEE